MVIRRPAAKLRSLLPLLIPARSVRDLPGRLAGLVGARLERLGVAAHVIAAEARAMTPVVTAPTIDRSVLGIMADFAKVIPYYIDQNGWDHAALPFVEFNNFSDRSSTLLTLECAKGWHPRLAARGHKRHKYFTHNVLHMTPRTTALASRAHAYRISVRILEVTVKRPKNLLLDAEALNRAEAYCEEHGTTLSRLVSDYLLTLPQMYERTAAKSPIVARLRGATNNALFETDAYREYLYGERRRNRHGDFD